QDGAGPHPGPARGVVLRRRGDVRLARAGAAALRLRGPARELRVLERRPPRGRRGAAGRAGGLLRARPPRALAAPAHDAASRSAAPGPRPLPPRPPPLPP